MNVNVKSALFGIVCCLATTTSVLAQKVYWTMNGGAAPDPPTAKVQRADRNGANAEDLVTNGLDQPRGISVDPIGGKVYWTDEDLNDVLRANLDGSNVETLIDAGPDEPLGLAVDPFAGKMYWTELAAQRIRRANIDGTDMLDVLNTTPARPVLIALDLNGGKMYWTEYDTLFNRPNLRRANLNGTNSEVIVGLPRGTTLVGVALDLAAGKVYWTQNINNDTQPSIQRANLDGTNVEAVLTSGFNNPPYAMAVDGSEGKMYWAEFAFLRRANLDGMGIEDVYSAYDEPGGLFLPWVLALDTPPGPGGLGACCDRSPGLGGACEENVLAGNCADPKDVWTPNATCDQVSCVEATGACCVTDGGACSDGYLLADCSGPGLVWTQDAVCNEEVCPDPLGACCFTSTAQCVDGVREVLCTGSSVVWTRDATCSPELCPIPTGACCDADTGVCDTRTQAACDCPNCTWTPSADCGAIECEPSAIPTVSVWGLVILSLVLLVCGKVLYGVTRTRSSVPNQ